MNQHRHKKTHKQTGFTIVELLIVIVVIAILAAISVVAYTGIQQRAKNAAITSSITNTIKLFNLYRAEYGSWPIEDQAGTYKYCIGEGYTQTDPGGSVPFSSPTVVEPARICSDYHGSTVREASWLSDELSGHGTLPGPVSPEEANGIHMAAPVYTTVPNNITPLMRGVAGLEYSSNAPVVGGLPGSRYMIQFGLIGDVDDCGGIQNAQSMGIYSTWTRCVILLESFE